MDSIQKGRLDLIERGDIDVMVIGTLVCYPNAETWKNHLGPDDSTLAACAVGFRRPNFKALKKELFNTARLDRLRATQIVPFDQIEPAASEPVDDRRQDSWTSYRDLSPQYWSPRPPTDST